MENWFTVRNDSTPVPLDRIPVIPYAAFSSDMSAMLGEQAEQYHCAAYFAVPLPSEGGLKFYALVARDTTSEVLIASHEMDYYQQGRLPSLTARIPAMHVFEREIAELHGLVFNDQPWDKPLRYPYNRFRSESEIGNYPFYEIPGRDLHQVHVGPVHAGIIEPGAFRFWCDGEKIVHLEIALGYQHRGLENQITSTTNRLRQITLAETICGDSAVAHATAMARIMESGYSEIRESVVDTERVLALEMERMAMHLADTGALCMDIAYQTGQVACEALRTKVINAMLGWCGNRFGKGLVRPFGTYYRLDLDRIGQIETVLTDVITRFTAVGKDLLNTPSVLARLELICPVTREQTLRAGAVGMAARMAGLARDYRKTHPVSGMETEEDFHAALIVPGGDLLARLKLRLKEAQASYGLAMQAMKRLKGWWFEKCPEPDYERLLSSDSLIFSLVEGWRGGICHVGLTGSNGQFSAYKIVDPSVHNWLMLALSVRGAQISDFPVSNKSFNLSYCGHDL